jgi:nucleotide-binding universal stress UspA family protein
MRKYKNILVAVDGSEPGFHAVEESIRLAQWGKGGVAVIHVAPSYEGDLSLVGLKNIKEAIRGPGKQVLIRALEIAAVHNFSIKPIRAEGVVHESIVRHAVVEDVDLIVLGARRTSFIASLLMGSVLTKTVKNSPKEVLVIPNQAAIDWEKIMFAPYNATCSKDTAARIIELAITYGGKLSVLSVIDASYHAGRRAPASKERLVTKIVPDCLEDLQTQAVQAGVKAENLRMSGRFHVLVSKVAWEEKVTMIILGLPAKTKPKWRIGRSAIKSIVRNSACPVLLIRNS